MAMERAGGDDLLLPPAAHGDTIIAAAAAAPGRLEAQELLYRVELQQGATTTTTGADRRKRRAMKNRESAERSRARKQAYMHELEQEVRLLRAENDALRHECQELKAAAAEAEAAKRPTLQRVSSTTF